MQGDQHTDTIVIGAGVFGAWTAEHLRRTGRRVLLVDAWGPAHARASSGGESRLTRAGYGASRKYSGMARDGLAEWKRLSDEADLPLFHSTGILTFYDRETPYSEGSRETLQSLGIRIERLGPDELRKRWPQMVWEDVSFGLFEPDFGALMARRAVATLVGRFCRDGGTYRSASILPPEAGARLEAIRTADGETLHAAEFVFACGPWLSRLFPEVVGGRLFVTRQEVHFFRPPAGDARFGPGALPGWMDFIGDAFIYGFPDLEGRGFKIALDTHGPIVDPDANDRTPDADSLAKARAYMGRRFPAMADAPLSESRVCQYENSSNGDLLIDRHPAWANVLLAGMGSGHGFKHGPEVGRMATALLADPKAEAEPMFSLQTKALQQARAVH